MSLFKKIFGDQNQKTINQLAPFIAQINELESQFENFSIENVRAKTEEFKNRLSNSETLDDILPEAFALVREAAKRTQKKRHFDVQLMGGAILHQGKIAEMHTGEGKTLVATLPAYLNGLTGKGVHVVTVNDYLSRRDAVWMGEIYNYLGLTVGVLNHETSYRYDETIRHEEEKDQERDETGGFRIVHEFLRPVNRREAYEADITYGTNNEYGFDYLRDNMAYDKSQVVQTKGHNYAIVDEVDSILIDESRTPLIISAPDVESTKLYGTFAQIVPKLIENEDYSIDEKLKATTITESGIEKVERLLNIKDIYSEGGTRYVHQLEQALKAHALFKLDRDYVVKNGEVIIVDEFTGRLMPGRRWSEGLHQAVEAKEKVMVQKESRTLATITFQNYFRLYSKLAGMTGTAQTSAEEFHKVYNIDVITVPTNKPMIRNDMPDRIYKTENGKFKALVQEIKERHLTGQPILVGTVSITKNELLGKMLEREGIPHKILNAKNHEQEGEIIAQAGKSSAVTVATNMAGRGVDIILGGNPPNPQTSKQVVETGGLHVIGTERHDARRIDNQLRGRSGRQGDPGSSQFFVSTEDELVRIFGGDRLKNLMDRLGVGEDDVIENRMISGSIEQAQSKIEGHNFDIRHYVLEYDDVMNRHRQAIYGTRNEILEVAEVKDKILNYIGQQIERIVAFNTVDPEWNIKEIVESINAMLPLDQIAEVEIKKIAESRDSNMLIEFLKGLTEKAMMEREKELGAETMRQLEKNLLLRVIDELWVEHLETMEHLRDSVRLRAYGQRDPLVEYKVEGQKMFVQLQDSISAQVANMIFKVSFLHQEVNRKLEQANVGEHSAKGQQAVVNLHDNLGRNDPCWCGSGKKYKKCHGK